MDRRPSSLQALFAEMKRRHVFRVMAVYGAVAFVVLQVADIAFEPLGLPEWAMTLVLMLAVLGLPVAVVLAWAFEQSPDGIRRTESAAPEEIEAIVAEPASRRWPHGIAALVGLGLLVGGAWWMGARSGAGGGAGGAIRSIAVLPFTTRTLVDASAEADPVVIFADGMHDDLYTQLSRIGDLRVTSTRSVEQFRDTNLDIRDIAGQLGVRYVIEAAVDQVGDRIRVNVRLIDAASDGHVWAETYDHTMTLDNLFTIRDDLTRRIAGSLRATLSPAVEAKIDERPTDNPEAFELYTRGRHVYDRGARPDLERAVELFERAVDLDPEFASAHAALAAAHLRMAWFGFVPASRALPAARASVERALSLDPDHAEALTRRALLDLTEGRMERARQTLERTLELNPSHADARAILSYLYAIEGYEYHALEEMKQAAELDPLAADIGVGLAAALGAVGRNREAVEQAAAVLELHPDYEPAAGALADALLDVGRVDEAVETLEQALRRNPGSIFAHEGLAWALLQTGRRDEALVQIERAVALTPDDFPMQGSRARMLRGAGRFAEAVTAAQEMVRLTPRNQRARALLADALLAVGDTTGARAHLDSARTMDVVSGEMSPDLVVGGLFRAGQVEEAVVLSTRIVEQLPGSVFERGRHARFLFETSAWAAHGPDEALAAFEQARRMSPREDHVLREYGRTLRELGRTAESLPLFETLVADQPGAAAAHTRLGWEQLVGQRDRAAAERAFRRALELDPVRYDALWGLARIHVRAGRADSAFALLGQAVARCGNPGCSHYYEVREAWLRAVAGDDDGARELLARYEGWHAHHDWNEWLPVLAVTHAELGDADHAFRLLDRAYALRSTELLELKVEPWFDPLRGDPRFDALLARMGL
jgi:tetratricopeptide (TPR) repeat protein/TolB-like protein